jgi:hypothetical protein
MKMRMGHACSLFNDVVSKSAYMHYSESLIGEAVEGSCGSLMYGSLPEVALED